MICGCYLAKEGLRVLIIEQYSKPGGCCTSFKRKGYDFDVGVHYLGAIQKGALGKILSDLDLGQDLNLESVDPSYKIIMPENVVYIREDPYDTIEEFKKAFYRDKNDVEKFFRFILETRFLSIFSKVKNMTFYELMSQFISNHKLKSTIDVLLANIGISSKDASALKTVILLREYVLDKVYYPREGIQEFPDAVVNKFKEYGGEIVFSSSVTKILTRGNRIEGVSIEDNVNINTKIVVSNIDAISTYTKLLSLNCKESKIVNNLQLSPAMFSVYLGISGIQKNIRCDSRCIVKCYSYDIDRHFFVSETNVAKGTVPLIVASFVPHYGALSYKKDKISVGILCFAPYASEDFWIKNRKPFADRLVGLFRKTIDIQVDTFDVIETATPLTYYRYTRNSGGAAFGWASTVEQVNSNIIPQKSSIKGLFLAGHWCIDIGVTGVPGVALSGRRAAELVIKEIDRPWNYGPILT